MWCLLTNAKQIDVAKSYRGLDRLDFGIFVLGCCKGLQPMGARLREIYSRAFERDGGLILLSKRPSPRDIIECAQSEMLARELNFDLVDMIRVTRGESEAEGGRFLGIDIVEAHSNWSILAKLMRWHAPDCVRLDLLLIRPLNT